MSEYMSDATRVMESLLKVERRGPDYQAGRMAMGLEIVSVLRTLDEIPSVMLPSETAAVVSVLETLLVQQGLTYAYEFYDRLSAARRPVFVADADPAPSLLGSASVSEDQQRDRASESGDSSSQVVELGDVRALRARLDALAEARRNQGALSSDESGELPYGGVETTPSE